MPRALKNISKVFGLSVIKVANLFRRRKEGVVFIRTDVLGDFFIFFPFFLRYLKTENHVFVVRDFLVPIYKLFTTNVIGIDEDRLFSSSWYRFKIFNRLNAFKYTRAVNLSPHKTHPSGMLLLKHAYPTDKIYYAGDKISGDISDDSFDNTKIVFVTDEKPYEHIFRHELNMLNFFEKTLIADVRTFYLSAFRILNETNNMHVPYKQQIVILTDSSQDNKRYPRDSWQKVLDSFPTNFDIIQIGLQGMRLTHPGLRDLTGKTTLLEAVGIVQHARLVIGNETGLTHLAYLSGVPTVCIVGGTNFGRFVPWDLFNDTLECVFEKMDCFGCNFNCSYVDMAGEEIPPCITAIGPELIIAAIERLNSKQYGSRE